MPATRPKYNVLFKQRMLNIYHQCDGFDDNMDKFIARIEKGYVLKKKHYRTLLMCSSVDIKMVPVLIHTYDLLYELDRNIGGVSIFDLMSSLEDLIIELTSETGKKNKKKKIKNIDDLVYEIGKRKPNLVFSDFIKSDFKAENKYINSPVKELVIGGLKIEYFVFYLNLMGLSKLSRYIEKHMFR